MATSAQGDPRDAILAHLSTRMPLTEGARLFVQGLLSDVDVGQLQTPADLKRAFDAMDVLAAHLRRSSRFTGSVDAQAVQMSLRDLCPLFPIC